MSALVWAWLRSRTFIGVSALCALVAVVSALAADATLLLPLINRTLRLPLLLLLLPSVVLTSPLQDRFGGMERRLRHSQRDRGLAVVLGCALVMATCTPAAAAAGERFPWRALAVLMVAAVAAVVLLGPLAWLVSTTLGMTYVYADVGNGERIRTTLDTAPAPLLAAALVAAATAYIVRGPRALN